MNIYADIISGLSMVHSNTDKLLSIYTFCHVTRTFIHSHTPHKCVMCILLLTHTVSILLWIIYCVVPLSRGC